MTGSTTPTLHPELVLDSHAELGEGPVWDAAAGELVWVDITARLVHRYRPADGSDRTIETPSHVGSVALRSGGGLVLALADGFWLLDPDATTTRRLAAVESGRPETRFNDGKCDPAGRFWAGTMAYDETPAAGTLYRLEPDGRVESMVAGVTISNGLAWSSDGRTFYYIDSSSRRVDAFDHDPMTGSLANRRPFVTLPDDEPGVPDGMAIDSAGCLWVALWGGWALHRYRPDGALEAVVPLPAARVTSCAFGGNDLEDLYITTASIGLSATELAEQPHAGGLFRVRAGVRGVAATPFAG